MRRSFIGFLASAILIVISVVKVAAQQTVDLQLILAADVSSSMDEDERDRQRRGYVEAFRSPELIAAIQKGINGQIAVTYFEWSGESNQSIIAPWTLISDEASAVSFSDQLVKIRARRHDTTSISGAMLKALSLFDESPFSSNRRVLDISGDGPSNQGPSVTLMRDRLVEQGIIINGLPMLLKRFEQNRIKELDLYYKECVIGGPGSFIVTAADWPQFPEALKRKLVLEITQKTPPARAIIMKAQAGTSALCS